MNIAKSRAAAVVTAALTLAWSSLAISGQPDLVATVDPKLASSRELTKNPSITSGKSASVPRQGGDGFLDAVVITLPFSDTGTTVGYDNDCGEMCFVSNAAPDAIYKYTPAVDTAIDVDLLGSQYDTVVYIVQWSPGFIDVIACNDTYYADDTSYLGNVDLVGGETYYIVVDGYWMASGDYVIAVAESTPCEIVCSGVAEGEPPLVTNYLDQYNGGCNSPQFGAPFQALIGDENGNLNFCGRSGWYTRAGAYQRDTDWFTARVGSAGLIEVEVKAQENSYLVLMGPQDCENVGVLQWLHTWHCDEAVMSIAGNPGDLVWLFVAPPDMYSPYPELPYTYSYVLNITGLEPGPIAVERATWGAVKALYGGK
jgi:hypothetical protein